MTVVALREKDIRVDRPNVWQTELPVEEGAINVLPQVRRTMSLNGDMEDLVESVLEKGQKVPGMALALTPRQAGNYLKEINELWGTKHQLRKLQKCEIDGVGYYLILVYGHRRLRACKRATARLREGATSTTFKGKYRCDIYFDMPFDEAFSFQLLENLYVRPSKHEEVAAMWRFWRYLKSADPEMTPAEFAKKIGRPTDRVREMLLFCDLPETVQEMINPDAADGKVSYTLLLQVARKRDAFKKHGIEMSDEEVVLLAQYLVAKRVSANEYAKRVTEEIRNLDEGQDDLFGIMTNGITKRSTRRVVAREIIGSLHLNIKYLHLVNKMTHGGAFGRLSPYAVGSQMDEDAEFSPDSPAKTALQLVRLLKIVVPDLAEMLERDGKSGKQLITAEDDLKLEEVIFRAVAE